jgi:hypothetical protein
MLIVSEKTKEFPDVKRFEGKINRKLQLLVVRDVKKLRNEHLINNVLNGIVIEGRIKWILGSASKKD